MMIVQKLLLPPAAAAFEKTADLLVDLTSSFSCGSNDDHDVTMFATSSSSRNVFEVMDNVDHDQQRYYSYTNDEDHHYNGTHLLELVLSTVPQNISSSVTVATPSSARSNNNSRMLIAKAASPSALLLSTTVAGGTTTIDFSMSIHVLVFLLTMLSYYISCVRKYSTTTSTHTCPGAEQQETSPLHDKKSPSPHDGTRMISYGSKRHDSLSQRTTSLYTSFWIYLVFTSLALVINFILDLTAASSTTTTSLKGPALLQIVCNTLLFHRPTAAMLMYVLIGGHLIRIMSNCASISMAMQIIHNFENLKCSNKNNISVWQEWFTNPAALLILSYSITSLVFNLICVGSLIVTSTTA